MPIYEYTCKPCGHAFETLVRSSDVPACPQCASTELVKQLSVTGKVGAADAAMPAAAMGPCGACGHPDGPGACRVH